MAPKQDAALFNKIIADGRERQKNEALANAMLGKSGRRSSAPGAGSIRKAINGSLASRVGISKASRVSSPLSRPASTTPSTSFRNSNLLQSRPLNRTNSDSRLDRKARALETITAVDSTSHLRNQVNFRDNPMSGLGFSFRGKAHGDLVTVVAQNFAEGTTAADIESVLQPMVDEDVFCKIVAARPTVIAEMQFKERANADVVVSTFNNKKADGRQLYVYVKDGANSSTAPRDNAIAPAGPRYQRGSDRTDRREQDEEMQEVEEDRRRYDEQRRHDEARRNERRIDNSYQDGRLGFQERTLDVRPARQERDTDRRGLYSDTMMRGRSGGTSYRGRGNYSRH